MRLWAGKGGVGWGGRIRTYGTCYQKALPYHLATPQNRTWTNGSDQVFHREFVGHFHTRMPRTYEGLGRGAQEGKSGFFGYSFCASPVRNHRWDPASCQIKPSRDQWSCAKRHLGGTACGIAGERCVNPARLGLKHDGVHDLGFDHIHRWQVLYQPLRGLLKQGEGLVMAGDNR